MFSESQELAEMHFSTQSVHAGEPKNKPYGSLTMPIVQTSTYHFENTEALLAHMRRKEEQQDLLRGEYGRYGNPTQETVENKLAALEGGEKALVFASGMAAITCTLLTFLSMGDHYILTDDCYRKTRQFSREFMTRFGVESTIVPLGDEAALVEAIRPTTRLVISETPTNPYLRIIDIDGLATTAREHGLLTVIDATFGSPYNLRPLEHGIDLVIQSGSKYLGGHNDLLAGAVIGSATHIAKIRETNGMLGPIPGPNMLYLLLRGLKTLSLRMERQNASGQRVAEFLERHPAVRRVWYPGLPSHPDHEIAKRLMKGFGGVISFEVDSDLEGTAHFIDALRIPYMGPSFGGVESIVEQPALMSHFTLDRQERAEIG
ncbi:MAG: aminotransferase class I/II-fold pyridoxal phosphate-dependent enzyme, partial [Anaerolineae bacterium]|nr:aminotransferase class I/II-fold pyridoxal phosphate-dependent enzyme [Anaerolineae bacterium]